MLKQAIYFATALAISPLLSSAATWNADAVCKKVQTCVTDEMKKQVNANELPAEMMQMIQAQIDGMCQTMNNTYNVTGIDGQKLEKCQNKLLSASCEALMSGDPIPECENIE